MTLDRPKSDQLYFLALKVLFWVLFAGVLAFAASFAWPIVNRLLALLTPFIVGLILAYVLHPVVSFAQSRLRLGRVAGVFLVAGSVVAVLATFIAILVPILYQQVTTIVDDLVRYISSGALDKMLLDRIFADDQKEQEFRDALARWAESLKINLNSLLDPSVIKPVAAGSVGAVRGTLGAIGSVFGWIGGTAVTVALSVAVAFYSLVGMAKIPSIIRRLIPGPDRQRTWDVLLRSNEAVGGFLRGQLMACTGVGILATIMLLLVGLQKYAVLIGFMAGAVNFIPYLGPTAGATPAVLWVLFSGDLPAWATGLGFPEWGTRLLMAGVVVAGFALVQMIDGLVFQPFIVGRNATLHPLAVMLALIIGSQFGIPGMILAVPAACIVKVIFIEYYWKNRSDFLRRGEPSSSSAPQSETDAGDPSGH